MIYLAILIMVIFAWLMFELNRNIKPWGEFMSDKPTLEDFLDRCKRCGHWEVLKHYENYLKELKEREQAK